MMKEKNRNWENKAMILCSEEYVYYLWKMPFKQPASSSASMARPPQAQCGWVIHLQIKPLIKSTLKEPDR